MSTRRKELLYVAVVIGFFLLMFRNLIVSGPFSMLDSEPPPLKPSFPPFFSLADYGTFGDISISTVFFYLVSLFGTLNAEKIETIAPFVLSVISFHFAVTELYPYNPRRKREIAYKDFVIYVLPFFYALNPAYSSMLYLGDSPGILFSMSFMPMVFLGSYRLMKDQSTKNLAFLSLFTVLSNLVYFEGFLFSFIFELPLMVLSLMEGKTRAVLLMFLSVVISFASELPEELFIYLVDVTAYKPIAYKITYDIFIYSVMIFSIFLSMVLVTWTSRLSKEGKREPLALTFVSALVMFLFVYLMHYPLDIPLVGSLVLTITTFPQKVFLLSFSLLLLSFPFFRFTWVLFLVLIVGVFLPSYSPLSSTYQELNFSPTYQVIPQFYQVYSYLSSHDPCYTIVETNIQTFPYRIAFFSWPDVVNVVCFNYQVAEEVNNATNGVKYVVTFLPLNDSNLTLIKIFPGNPTAYLYESKVYQGLILFPNGTGAGGKLVVNQGQVQVKDGNYTGNVILLLGRSFFLNAKSYNGLVEVHLSRGEGEVSFQRYFYFFYVTLPVSIVFFLIPFYLLLKERVKLRLHGWLNQWRNNT
ncbi:hypothetical protein [Sulfuracidifex tepidarius]|uniref:Uncharacterized protein n=1 Tax=Sulfuracidifex tepidarius TaxID=1294262 RepID=A0A510E490_9CREN|nr:hypothetical protein [Sulfuracidifex tepidarius]BBG26890.1 hypothetical protein IC007_1413 [Sulfuracidifex tepidarius]